jgi:hypothetical protein
MSTIVSAQTINIAVRGSLVIVSYIGSCIVVDGNLVTIILPITVTMAVVASAAITVSLAVAIPVSVTVPISIRVPSPISVRDNRQLFHRDWLALFPLVAINAGTNSRATLVITEISILIVNTGPAAVIATTTGVAIVATATAIVAATVVVA